MSNERFVNPYNFISLPSEKKLAYGDTQDLYGVIHYTLTTETPLFIPNSSNAKVFKESNKGKHKSYDFYSYTDLRRFNKNLEETYEPVIPGSEIRGVVRNVYETLTDSCMSQLNSDIKKPKLYKGYIRKDNNVISLCYRDKDKKEKIVTNLNDEDINKLNNAIKNCNKSFNCKIPLYKKSADKEYYVYYVYKDKKIEFLAPTKIVNMNLKDYAGSFAPCEKKLCPACDLFGKIGENGKGSHIRFSDMLVIDKKPNWYCKPTTIAPLASPKIKCYEFYLKEPDSDVDYWTYFTYEKEGETHLYKSELRGRKYYWHHDLNAVKNKLKKNQNPSSQNKTIRPVKENVSFKGDLYFDGISKKQLKQLVWILNCGQLNNENNKQLGLKLGMGKPLGLGSVSLIVNDVNIRKISKNNNQLLYQCNPYSTKNLKDYLEDVDVGFSTASLEEFEKIADLNAMKGIKVCYPYTLDKEGKKDFKSFNWFKMNRTKKDDDGNEIKHVNQALPSIKNPYLETYTKEDASQENNDDSTMQSSEKQSGQKSYFKKGDFKQENLGSNGGKNSPHYKPNKQKNYDDKKY